MQNLYFEDIKLGRIPKPLQQWMDSFVSPEQPMPQDVQEKSHQQMGALSNLVIAQDNGKAVAELLRNSLFSSDWMTGKDVLPMHTIVLVMLDLKQIKVDQVFFDALTDYETIVFPDLSYADRLLILRLRLLSLLPRVNVLMELEEEYLVSRFGNDEGSWEQGYLNELLDNEELIGSKTLLLNNQQIQPTVSTWIEDYMTFTQKSFIDPPGTYDLIKYMNTADSVKSLNVPDKQLLNSLLRLVSWLIDPDITEQEVFAYQNQRTEAINKWLGEPPKQEFKGIRFVSPTPSPKPVQDIRFKPAQPVVSKSVPQVPKSVPYSPPANVNIQKILNSSKYSKNGQTSGVVFDQQSNVKVEEMAQRLEAERQKQKVSIDQKLEALKKRKKI